MAHVVRNGLPTILNRQAFHSYLQLAFTVAAFDRYHFSAISLGQLIQIASSTFYSCWMVRT